MTKFYALFSLTLCVLLSGCCKKDTPQPLDQLSPTTQEGKNTFGCLLNGQAWTPKGAIGLTSNYSVSYDPGYDGGTFDLRTYRVYGKATDERQYMVLYSNNLLTTGTYSLNNRLKTRVSFNEHKTNCEYWSYDVQTTFSEGTLTITRLDLNKGIIAGTFEFTLAKPGCDTIRVTNGRFDKKL